MKITNHALLLASALQFGVLAMPTPTPALANFKENAVLSNINQENTINAAKEKAAKQAEEKAASEEAASEEATKVKRTTREELNAELEKVMKELQDAVAGLRKKQEVLAQKHLLGDQLQKQALELQQIALDSHAEANRFAAEAERIAKEADEAATREKEAEEKAAEEAEEEAAGEGEDEVANEEYVEEEAVEVDDA